MSFHRPKVEDTEEDLLEFQRQFLESGLRPAVEVIKKRKNVSNTELSEDKNVEVSDIVEMDVDSPKKSRLSVTVNRQDDIEPDMDNVEAEMEEKDTHITSVLSRIVERDTIQAPIYFPTPRTNAFPPVSHRLGQRSSEQKKIFKKSIFAREFKKKSDESFVSPASRPIAPCGLTPLPSTIPMNQLQQLYPRSAIISGSGLSFNSATQHDEGKKIHEENLERLSGMSESETLLERNKLLQEMDPKVVEFLQKKSILSKSLKPKNSDENIPNQLNLDDSNSPQPGNILDDKKDTGNATPTFSNYLHMDIVEPEKLAWTEEVPETKLKEVKSSHRFNFNGDVMKEGEDVPTHLGLHHHGENPDLPGYTLKELFILSRSKFTQTRVLAITLIGKIVAKAKTGQFVNLSSENIIESLLEAGLLFLLRWSLDEHSETLLQASIFALHSLLCDSQHEDALNEMFVSDRGCEFPSLSPGVKTRTDSSDHEVAESDVIAGLVRMKILPRIRYILEVAKPGLFMIRQCLDIVKRICCHSLQSAVAVYECPRLVDFVIHSLILNRGQCPQAVAMLRAVCVAGKHVSSRLLNDYNDVKTVIYKYIGGCRNNDDLTDLCIEIEVWRLWITLSSYGLMSDTFRELFSIITTCMQEIASKLTKLDQMAVNDGLTCCLLQRAQLVCKMCSTALISAKNLNLSEWIELTEQMEIICNLTNEQLLMSSENSKIAGELKILYGSSMDYMSSYCQCLKNTSNGDITLIAQFSENTAMPTLNRAIEFIKLNRFPRQIIPLKGDRIGALPRITGLSCERDIGVFQLLASYLRCCVSALSLDKSICRNLYGTVAYLAENCRWMTDNIGVQSFLMRNRVYCLYWATLLYLKLVADEPTENTKFSHFFFKVAFKCFGQLTDGDEHMMHHLLSTVLFNSDLLVSLANSSAAAADEMASLDMSRMISAMAPSSPSKIVESMITSLPSVRATYLQSFTINSKTLEKSKARYFHKCHEIPTYLLPSCDETCAPSDWTFIPLLQLYDYGLNKSLPVGSATHSVNCLRYLCFIERHCKDCLDGVPISAKLVRIMCVYIAGNDLFLEHPIQECLAFLFSHYCKSSRREDLDFTQMIPGISSFFDFYLSLLEQYESVSFGDELFGAVVLLPLHQLNGGIADVKKALWCDHVELLRLLSLPISKLLIPLSWYLYPIENDISVIRSYLHALASGNCSQARCPVLYTVAVHHTAGFLFDKSVNVPVTRRIEICRGVQKLRSEVIRKHILHYDNPIDDDAVTEIGFRFTEEMSDVRRDDVHFLCR